MADTPSLPIGQVRLLKEAYKKGDNLLKPYYVPNQHYKAWNQYTLELLKSVFGEKSPTVKDFEQSTQNIPKQQGSLKFYSCPNEHRYSGIMPICPKCGKIGKEDNTRIILMQQLRVINAAGWMLPTDSLDFFDEFDPDIRKVSLPRFKDEHYADAVSAAFKALNSQVRAEYKRQTRRDLDGTPLMESAFSPKSPVFKLADLNTPSGENIQQGFQRLFAGSMIGIRNPHAHENLTLDFAEAKHFLYLADLLMKKFKDALGKSSP
jgi:uncharacterized protein (TIGR02391 family)